MGQFEKLNAKSQTAISLFQQTLNDKIKALDELIELERNYHKTLPRDLVKQKKEEDKVQDNKQKRYINQSTNRETKTKSSNLSKGGGKANVHYSSFMFTSPSKDGVNGTDFNNQSTSGNRIQGTGASSQGGMSLDMSHSPSTIPSASPSDKNASINRQINQQKHQTPLIGSRGLINNFRSKDNKITIPTSLLSLAGVGANGSRNST